MDQLIIIIQSNLIKIISFIIVIILAFFMRLMINRFYKKIDLKYKEIKINKFHIRVISNIVFLFIISIAFLIFWSGLVNSLIVIITSIIGIFAIAFFASWSLLSNILSYFLLIFNNIITLDTYIKILPLNVEGKVVNISSFIVTLEDNDNNIIKIPNNIVFQNYVIVVKK